MTDETTPVALLVAVMDTPGKTAFVESVTVPVSVALIKRWARKLSPWSDLARSFRQEGFYERFPAKGQVERVARVRKELARAANIERRGKAEDTED